MWGGIKVSFFFYAYGKYSKKCAYVIKKEDNARYRKMSKRKDNPKREKRIAMEIVVDAYDAWEQAMGWYYYLEGTLKFPFLARCIKKRDISPLSVKEEVEVIGMPSEEECEKEMFVTIKWQSRQVSVPLSQLDCRSRDKKTKEAITDWHYWVDQGYSFG